ncbi:MAG: hypothetical protein HZA16_09650 [Nitrospirae bacterium]|nr:hypothetical protein [Nitrospirota bacterium]
MKEKVITIMSALVLVLIITVANASAMNSEPWTTVGSSGTVDEADMGMVSLNGGIASILSTAVSTSVLNIRYNVVAVDGLLNNLNGTVLTARFLDNGSGARVILRLKKYDFDTGITSTLLTLDSNSFSSSPSYQVQSVGGCSSGITFDFYNNAYFIDAEIQKTATGGSAGLAIISIGHILC